MDKLISWLCLAIVATVALAFSAASRSVSELPSSEAVFSVDVIESDSVSSDSISLPPTKQTFTSGDYQLVIEAAAPNSTNQLQTDQWQTEAAIAYLNKNDMLQWEKALPHAYGPRFVVLNTDGQTLLLDEFINVASPYAITLISATGKQVAQYSFEDIEATLSLPTASITQQATSGWWISAPPALSQHEEHVFIQTGGRQLMVELVTGELTVN